jgi:hypothetical protein
MQAPDKIAAMSSAIESTTTPTAWLFPFRTLRFQDFMKPLASPSSSERAIQGWSNLLKIIMLQHTAPPAPSPLRSATEDTRAGIVSPSLRIGGLSSRPIRFLTCSQSVV